MNIVCISDTHTKHKLIEEKFGIMPDADVIIHAGDISTRGEVNEIKSFLKWFSNLEQFKYKIFIAGNHDFLFEEKPKIAESFIPENVIYLNDSGIEINGLKFWGSPVSPRFYNWAFNRDRGDDINNHWNLIPNDTDILITHTPLKGYGDFAKFSNDNVGCYDLLQAVLNIKPKYHICGHIHEGYGEYIVFNGKYTINASSLDENYYLKNKPILINV